MKAEKKPVHQVEQLALPQTELKKSFVNTTEPKAPALRLQHPLKRRIHAPRTSIACRELRKCGHFNRTSHRCAPVRICLQGGAPDTLRGRSKVTGAVWVPWASGTARKLQLPAASREQAAGGMTGVLGGGQQQL